MYIKNNLAFIAVKSGFTFAKKTKHTAVVIWYRPLKDSGFLVRLELIIFRIRYDCEVMLLGNFNINKLAPKTYSLLKKKQKQKKKPF